LDRKTYLVEGGELEKSLFDGAIVIYVYSVLEHIVHKILVGLYKLIQLLQGSKFFTLLVVENIEVDVAGVDFHIFDLQDEVVLLIANLLVSLFQFLLLILETSNLFVYLLLHHRV
jgi:hypothetical protein